MGVTPETQQQCYTPKMVQEPFPKMSNTEGLPVNVFW